MGYLEKPDAALLIIRIPARLCLLERLKLDKDQYPSLEIENVFCYNALPSIWQV